MPFMPRFLRSILFFLCMGICFSCSEKEQEKQAFLYSVTKKNYEDFLLLEGSVEAVKSTKLYTSTEVWGAVVSYLVEDGTYVQAGDTVCILEYKSLEDAYEEAKRYIDTYKAELNKGKADLELSYALLQAQVHNNEIQANISNLDSLQLQYYSPAQRRIAELNLEKTRIEKRKLEYQLKALDVVNKSELRKMELRIRQAELLQQEYEARLNMLVLVTPTSGLALRGESRISDGKIQEGEEAFPRIPIIEIPNPEELCVRLKVAEQDYKRLQVGQKVCYTFSGMPQATAYGEIMLKTPIGEPLSRDARVKVFDVLASVDSCTMLPTAGLSANCLISLQQIEDTLSVPVVSVFEEDSIRVVYIQDKTSYIQQEVMIGRYSPREVVVYCGLQGGEKLSMLKPDIAQIKERRYLTAEQKRKYKLKNTMPTDSMPPMEDWTISPMAMPLDNMVMEERPEYAF